MANENASLNKVVSDDSFTELFDLAGLEADFENQLNNAVADLTFLEEEKKKIGNPDALGQIVHEEIWNQFANQIGLDITNETLNQKYDREHLGECYADIGKEVMKDPRYKNANNAMVEQKKAGALRDQYTGKQMGIDDKANLDHVVSRKEIDENRRRKQAGISTKDLANKDVNLKATNESLNKSKGKKSIEEYCSNREQREKDLRKQAERKKKKIDESNKSEVEKKLEKEKINKRLQDKLDADEKLMQSLDKEARNEINKDIYIGVCKETTKKAAKDALKQMAITAIISLLKEIMNGFVRFLKSQRKSISQFLAEMKISIKTFLNKIFYYLKVGVHSALGTVVTEIFGPFVSMFKKIGSLIKVGVSSLLDAIKYLNSPENREKPFSIKVSQVGKIVMAGLVAGSGIFLSEVFEKVLLTVPGMQIELPLLGTLANVIGAFLSSLLAGLSGAIVINIIDKFIAKKQKACAQEAVMSKGNTVISKQRQLRIINEAQLENRKREARFNIENRRQEAVRYIKNSHIKIMENFVTDLSNDGIFIDSKSTAIMEQIDTITDDLDDLLE